ncbi:hypothetical protein NM208_g8338 [Fusarium decemcellulare]|uniref:Uncharacterized protein n=1 Tax=Fusarium decemcellulare TaxID=57161 RepID=A0ACC1S5P0_9HYPO|nr:hypothetical protein NM208_g8338 [Fusarium decemcellulare]
MSLVSGEKSNFQFILRLLNTNVDGKQKVMYALTKIKGVGRRYSNLVCKKADVDLNKRAGELTSEELERIVTIIQNPTQYKIPTWFLNRQRDIVDGKDSHILANGVDSKLHNVTNVPHALFTGKRTAVFLHVRLERENQAVELANEPAKRDTHLEARDVWERANGKPGDLLYAGDFDQ